MESVENVLGMAASVRGFGKRPEDRSLPELLRFGVVNIDKPQGPTSHQVTAWVRDILGLKKTGHGGTLDPRVTGVLPVATSDATRAIDALHRGSKEYVGVMRLHQHVPRKKLEATMARFVGIIFQTPPLRSAVKREQRTREIHELEILESRGRDVLIRVRCQAGTYIRTLCVDIGEALGVGAHLQDLRRTRVGSFTEEDAVTLHALKDAYVAWREDDDPAPLTAILKPGERLLEHLPKVLVKDTAVDSLCHGADLAVPGIIGGQAFEKGEWVALMTSKGEGIALGVAARSSDEVLSARSGLGVQVFRVLMEPGTYPRLWKKR
jgi:H/ACA ribonucleoprotein complex subunit 4